jgi:hypothetical protein
VDPRTVKSQYSLFLTPVPRESDPATTSRGLEPWWMLWTIPQPCPNLVFFVTALSAWAKLSPASNCQTLEVASKFSSRPPVDKVIIEKSRGEVFLVGQDTIENVSYPIKNLKCSFKVLYIFDTSKCATIYRNIFEVYT